MRTKKPTVYIMASKINGTLYTGVTSDLLRRVIEHKEGTASEDFILLRLGSQAFTSSGRCFAPLRLPLSGNDIDFLFTH